MLAKDNVCSITVTGQKQVSIGRSVRKYVSIIFKLITEFKHVDESTCYDYNNKHSIDGQCQSGTDGNQSPSKTIKFHIY